MAVHRPNPETDPFRPPAIPTEVVCLHCQQEYESYLMEWREQAMPGGKHEGFWCCPTSGCDGRGFGFDIFPIDPEYCDEQGESFGSFFHDDDDGEVDVDEAIEDEEADLDAGQSWLMEPIDADALLEDGDDASADDHPASPPYAPPPITLEDFPRSQPWPPRLGDDDDIPW